MKQAKGIAQPAPRKDYFVTVLSVAFVLGMGLAIAVYFAWRSGMIPPGLEHLSSATALLICPPFILSVAFGPSPDSDLALTLVAGTIVFANAFLYAGVAAGGYFVVTALSKHRRDS